MFIMLGLRSERKSIYISEYDSETQIDWKYSDVNLY